MNKQGFPGRHGRQLQAVQSDQKLWVFRILVEKLYKQETEKG